MSLDKATASSIGKNVQIQANFRLQSISVTVDKRLYSFISPKAEYGMTCGASSLASNDGNLVITAHDDATLQAWEFKGQQPLPYGTMKGHVGDVYTCQLFPSGKVVLSSGADTQIKIW
eukprot:CAMPEP_0168517172 /NCGR_PEP_ID=MMETSP0405-20121227/5870_1 /TAXON_ID=498012 /ORGANISM="Trichosphaerium sp, Strain Am-I-7 wt" /LENGTH=117 /DNA_ID=CAMNT_0008537085 /DNA_START=158 /DNA_END=508 /DNA_ORIENTATION=-